MQTVHGASDGGWDTARGTGSWPRGRQDGERDSGLQNKGSSSTRTLNVSGHGTATASPERRSSGKEVGHGERRCFDQAGH